MKVDDVLDRLRVAYGVADLAALAQALDKDETTFRVWRNRGEVPPKVLVTASAATGRSINWLRADEGHGDAGVKEPPPFFPAAAKQVNLTPEERALLENYRAATPAGRLAIEAASAALAKQSMKKGKTG